MLLNYLKFIFKHPNISQDELLEKSASIFNGVLNLTTDSLFVN